MTDKLLFIILLCFASCATLTRQMNEVALKGNLHAVVNGVYIRDKSTGLCFLVIDAYQGASITVVPCDSMKRINVKNIYITRK